MGKGLIAMNPSNSLALTVIEKTEKLNKKFFAGDPSTLFHELRRFLYSQGVDSKMYSAAQLPSIMTATGRQTGNSMKGVYNIDNGFFCEFRSMVSVGAAEKRTVINTLIFVLRVFIDVDGDGNSGKIQILLNHLHDAIFDLDDMYSALLQFLCENNWEQPCTACDGSSSRMSLVSNMIFERHFKGEHEFTSMYYKLKPILEYHQMVGSHLPIESPF
jgi:hypothetical protein